ncbi:MAG: carbon-nitrogen hydrolase [Candidatus Azobacteroides pseudotrichonymphae]|jgi:N-carbamoylputrescine amidase|uniref:N-carbamoylputrescine amidase n=1 Tax=Azobacteroides pseudotrichonymphae genomovar. CFP2 TaxID=511995 RepID=B6YRQ7_AZOPC|nr:carbon-nitrogen hydrolase [Candidatus Azobacteroides pseudotrichonymphae]BAG83879.1 N-carbamoylputrescine amidase [Candidatus Azobacteroides pseudotrichonymphae genomovar. CFP2]GMO33059.1 MAG: carbon-nitrogen hydrolase [Candidatus Azobacteroides pseudotrichonymphae]
MRQNLFHNTSIQTQLIKLGLVQQSNTSDIQSNIHKLITNIRWCAAREAQLIVLPELHNSLYFCQTENIKAFDISESIPGYSTRLFGKLAQELGIILILSLFERRTLGLYHNTAVVIERDGNIVGRYRKMHIPDDPAYYEKFYFAPGDLGFQPIQTSLGRLGILICWDQWYPEAARLMALSGADILIYPTAIGYESSDTDEEKRKQKNAWIISQQAHAIHNGLPSVTVNRVGHEYDSSGQTNGILFWGNSFVCGGQGEIIAQASDMQEENLIVDINFHRQEEIRRVWPFLRDRRIDAYENLTRRFID